jgi:hypothetical protein
MPPVNRMPLTSPLARLRRSVRPSCRSILVALAAVTGVGVVVAVPALTPASALDDTPWTLPAPPPRCTTDQANAGDVAGCIVAFYDDPSTTGWGVPPAPGVGDGWTWGGYRYNGSAALTGWESTWIDANTDAVAGLRAGSLETHTYARALFEGFLDEISANGYRVREASGYSFRCTAGSGGWECPSGDPDDLSNHAWGLAIDFNSAANPIRSYSGVDGQTACLTPIVTDLPRWVIQTAEKWGLYWGGYGWNSGCPTLETQRTIVSRDPPHFEFRGTPEQAAAIAAFNLGNNPNAFCRTVVNDAGAEVESCTMSPRPGAGTRLPVRLTPPEGAVAAMINLTATDGSTPGFLTLEDCGPRTGTRTTSAITYTAGESVAAMAIVPIAADGRFCVYRSSAVHSLVDVSAYLGSDGSPLWFSPTTPTRLTDSRTDGACLPQQDCIPGAVPAASAHVVPTATADAAVVNLTVVDARAPGYAQIGRCPDVGPASTFSNINVMNAGARANLALVPATGDAGTCAFTLTEANVIVDELGTLTSEAGYGWSLAPPRRVADTRECTDDWCSGKPGAGGIVRVPLGTTAPAAAIAITVTEAGAAGYVTVGPCDDIRAGAGEATSNVNFAKNATVTGLAVVAVEDGEVCAYTRSPVHVVVDVQAELTTEQTVGVLPVTPERAHDSRDAG